MDHEQQAREMLFSDQPGQKLAALIAREEMMRKALINARDMIATDRTAFVDCSAVHGLTDGDDPDNFVVYADGLWIDKDDAEAVRDYDRALAMIDAALAPIAAEPAQPNSRSDPPFDHFDKLHAGVFPSAQPAPVAQPVQTLCGYPDCNCPFDAPADPSWCALGLPHAAPVSPPAPPCPRGLPEREEPVALSQGELWSLMRSVMQQGADIRSRDEPSDYYHARLDAEASHRAAQLVRSIDAALTSARTAGRREALEEAMAACRLQIRGDGTDIASLAARECEAAIRALPDAQG